MAEPLKPLRRLLDRVRPSFETGGRLHRLHPLFEALDTLVLDPGHVTCGSVHVRDALDLKRMMTIVLVALLPCILMAMQNTGYQAHTALRMLGGIEADGWRASVMAALGASADPASGVSNLIYGALWFVPVYVVTMAVGGFWEVLFAIVRKKEVNEGFFVTGMLLPLTLPPTVPLWQVALGVSFGVVLGKEVFGGTGKNFLNPALAARAFLFFAYPGDMSGEEIWTAADGFSGATPLGALAGADVSSGMSVITGAENGGIGISWSEAFLGFIPGSMGETSTLACLFGALVLVVTRVGSWRIMLAMLLGTLVTSGLFYAAGSQTNPMFLMPPHWHLVVGGLAFGLVFMATDPVSAAMTEAGRWIYGGLIGAVTVVIRVANPAYPEGVMLAILLGNVFAPVIDWCVIEAHIKRRAARRET